MVQCRNLTETNKLAATFAKTLHPGDMVLLCGELGSGKTTFTRGMAPALGVNPDIVASPTFTLMGLYPGRVPVIHVDFYRLPHGDDVFFEELEDMLTGDSIVVIEWGDRFMDRVREWSTRRLFIVRFDMISEEVRNIIIEEDTDH